MSVFPDQLIPSPIDLWALADALDRFEIAVADYNKLLGGRPAVTILESDRRRPADLASFLGEFEGPKAALRTLLDTIDNLLCCHLEEVDPNEVIGWRTPENCSALSDDLRESQHLVFESISTLSKSFALDDLATEGRLKIFVEGRENLELLENPSLQDLFQPRFAMWWHAHDEADGLAEKIQRHHLNAWDWEVAHDRLENRYLSGEEFLKLPREKVILFEKEKVEDAQSRAEAMGPEFVLRVQQRRESEEPPVDYFESEGEDWPSVVLAESFIWPQLPDHSCYGHRADRLRDYVNQIRERQFPECYGGDARFSIPVSELPYGFWSEGITEQIGKQAFAPHLVEEPEREWRGPYPLDYYDDPFNRAREISIQHGLSPADGENPLWVIQQFDVFTAGRDPASEVTFQQYMLRKHPGRRLTLSGEPGHEANSVLEELKAKRAERNLTRRRSYELFDWASRELGESDLRLVYHWLQEQPHAKDELPDSFSVFKQYVEEERSALSSMTENVNAFRDQLAFEKQTSWSMQSAGREWPCYPWKSNDQKVYAHWSWHKSLRTRCPSIAIGRISHGGMTFANSCFPSPSI